MAEGIWLRLGYRGPGERFWQAVAAGGARAQRIGRKGGELQFDLPLAELGALRRALGGEGRLHLLGVGGWPLALRALRRRPWRLAWPVAALVLYILAAGRVWQVAVTGPQGIPTARILREASALGLKPGAPRAGIDAFRLGQEIGLQVPGLIFAAVRLDGVRAVIYAAPALTPPEALPPAARGALFAGERGYVTRVVVLRGLPLVRAGQTVVRGEPLVAPRAGESRGQVFARVWRRLTYRFPVDGERTYRSGRQATRWYISTPWRRQWTRVGPPEPFPEARRAVRIWRIPLASVEVARYTYVELRTLKVVLSPRYAELRATSLALATVERTMPGAELLALRTQVRRIGGDFRVEVAIEAETDIAHAKAGGSTQD